RRRPMAGENIRTYRDKNARRNSKALHRNTKYGRGKDNMRKYLLGTAFAPAAPGAAMAAEQCGEVSMAEMNWASAKIVVATSKFLLEQGYGCDVKVIPSDTTPAVTPLAENNEPDI